MVGKFLLPAAALMAIAIESAAAQSYPDRLLWGDTHLHTNLSTDAYFLQNHSVDAATSYRFAMGEPVINAYSRARVQLKTPLDFLAVSDHAETLAVPYNLFTLKNRELADTRLGRRLIDLFDSGHAEDAFGMFVLAINAAGVPDAQRPPKVDLATALRWRFEDLVSAPDLRARAERWLMSDPSLLEDLNKEEIYRTAWASNMDAAEKYYRPGKFSTLVAWEYTPTPNGANLHRVVLSPMTPTKAKTFMPFSSRQSGNPEDLWKWLDETKASLGEDFLSIPHNSNISKGRMFASVDFEGRPLTAQYARLRAAWEPVAEVTQIKGTSETHPALSPSDEFASFEFFNTLIEARADGDHTPTVTPADYVRGALKSGLEIEKEIGVNPYKLGMIGSTDAHGGLSAVEEDNFQGKFAFDSVPEMKDYKLGDVVSGWDMSASGLAAVWARENTREEIFAALKRREVYATTGPRISVRFFGGFGFSPEDAAARDIAALGYAKGVPMGGDLAGDGLTGPPSFLVHAVKDPKEANLDRIQIVKGWLAADGKAREKVFDVAWSAGRSMGADGRLEPVGDTVDAVTATFENTIGAAELAAVWTDPEFEASQNAFYYVRVLQIPTPRNSVYDSVALQKAPPEGYAVSIQERAFTSPIWYSSSKS